MRRIFLLACLAVLICVPTLVSAQPEFVLVNEPIDIGNGEWEFQYLLTNYNSPSPVYDIEFEYSIAAACISVNGPDGWAMSWEGPLARWATDSNPCIIEQELGGFYIVAGLPAYTVSPITFTDENHVVFASGEALLPVPEPGSLLALGTGIVGLAAMRRRS